MAVAVTVTLILSVALTVLNVDISDLRDFETDAINRPLQRPAEPDRYADPSPFSIWLPSDLFVWDSIRAGKLPLWNRLQGGGYSPVVLLQEGVLHPLRWLTAVYPRRSAPSVLILLILAGAMTGMYLLARYDSELPALVAFATAGFFALSPLMISFSQFSGAALPLAHTPWIVLFYRRASRSGTRSFAGLVLSMALLVAAGHPLLVACVIFTVGLVACGDAFSLRSARPLAVLAIGGILAAMIAAPAILPLLVSRSEIWTYKTSTSAGYSYVMYSLKGWLSAMRALVVDVYPYGACCVDLDAYFLFLGIPLTLLLVTGVSLLLRTRQGRVTATILALTFVVAVPGPWMVIVVPQLSFFKPWYLAGSFIFIVSWVAGSGLHVLYRANGWRRIAGVLLAAAALGMYTLRSREVLRPRLFPEERSSSAIRFLEGQAGLFRVMGLRGQMHIPNSSRLTGIEDVRLSAPILPLRYHWWWQLIDPRVLNRAFPTTRVSDHLQSPLVSDFNVAFLLQARLAPLTTYRSNPDESLLDTIRSPFSDLYPLLFRNRWVEVRQIASAVNPRAHFVARAIAVPDLAAAVALLEAQPALPRLAHIVEIVHPPALPRAMSGTVGIRYPSDSEVVLDVRSRTGGIVVLHDTFATGWTGSLAGSEVTIYPVNILSRGIIVPPGNHEVRMSYRPPGFAAGIALSLATMGGLLALLLRRGRVLEQKESPTEVAPGINVES